MTEPASTQPARGIHPGYVIAAFFSLLLLTNIAFLAVAMSQPSDALPKASVAAEAGARP